MRGADHFADLLLRLAQGSSPLARGRWQDHRVPQVRPGFIPACAGQIQSRRNHGRSGWVHPRLRGADGTRVRVSWLFLGSSPLARGRSRTPGSSWPEFGFIPACAGQISGQQFGRWRAGVHPRLRGADNKRGRIGNTVRGSSPLARGRCIIFFFIRYCGGFIPACAGQITTTQTTRDISWVHPRLRGADS